MKYDIVHLVRVFLPNIGGMETLVHEIAQRQANRGKKVLVITSNRLRNGVKLCSHEETLSGYQVLRLPSFILKGVYLPAFIGHTQISTKNLHVHGMDPFVDYAITRINYSRAIISPHGGFFHTNSLLWFKKFYFRFISTVISKKSNGFYCISENDMNLSRKLSNKVFFMGCGSADLEFSSECRVRTGVLTWGRISKNKCVDDVINVFNNNFDNGKLTIVGPNPEKINFSVNHRVDYRGALDFEDLKSCIYSNKYYISMSSYEGLGMSLVEALKSGLIPIVRRIPAYSHIDYLIREYTGGISTIKFIESHEEYINLDNIPDEHVKFVSEAARALWNWDSVVSILEEAYES